MSIYGYCHDVPVNLLGLEGGMKQGEYDYLCTLMIIACESL